MKKRMLCMMLTAAVAMTAAGCGGAAEEGQTSSGVKDAGTESKVSGGGAGSASGGSDIVIWTQMENEVALLQEYADKWGEETGNTVTVTNISSDVQQFFQAANSADGPDGMFGIPNDQLADYVSAGLVAEVPKDLYDNAIFADAAVQATYVEGAQCAVPISVETPFLFYNTDKIKEVPKTWEEMAEMAKDHGGIVYEATSVYYNLGMLRAFDSYIFNYKDGSYDTADIGLGSENAVAAYEFVNRLSSEYGFFSSDITFDLAKSSFQNGEAAFYIGGAWDVTGFTEAGTPFGVSDMPTLNGKDFVTPVGTYVGFVSAKSDRQPEVFALYKYLAEEAAVDLYETGDRIPALLAAQETVGSDSKVTAAQIAQIAKGEPLPTVSEMGLIWQPFSDNMKLMFAGTITPEEAASYIQEQVEEAIALMQSGQ